MTEARRWPARQVQMGQSSSLCVMPHAATFTSTSQNIGLGSGASSKTSPLMPVRSCVRMAFIVSPLPGRCSSHPSDEEARPDVRRQSSLTMRRSISSEG